MGEVLEVIKENYLSRGKSNSSNQLQAVKVRNALLRLCEENLKEPEDVLTFEVMKDSLPFAVAVLDDDVLATQYQIVQISETLFEARMVILEGVF